MNLKKIRMGFSIAEALITLMIISMILAAVLPVVSKKRNTNDSVWQYVSNGTGANSSAYFALGNSQSAILGYSSLPDSSNKSKLVVVAPKEDFDNDDYPIQRSLIDFYQQQSGVPALANTGRIAFDTNGNIAIGRDSLTATTPLGPTDDEDGSANTAVGFRALSANYLGYNNTALGNKALESNVAASDNVGVGYRALQSTTGSGNTGIGSQALASNKGAQNTAVGYNALRNNTSGISNVAIGSGAGNNTNDSNKLYIESNTAFTGVNSLIYGDFAARFIRINGTIFNASNVAYIASDKRLKDIKCNFSDGIDKILKINPVSFVYKKDPKKLVKTGVIAQDLQKIFPDSVTKGPDGYLYVDTSEILFALVNSVKQLHLTATSNADKITNLENIVKTQQEEINLIKQQNELLVKQLSLQKNKKH